MKKLLLILALVISANAYAATFTLWYKSCTGCQWSKGTTYMDFGACENAKKYHWAQEKRCVAD